MSSTDSLLSPSLFCMKRIQRPETRGKASLCLELLLSVQMLGSKFSVLISLAIVVLVCPCVDVFISGVLELKESLSFGPCSTQYLCLNCLLLYTAGIEDSLAFAKERTIIFE